MLEIDPVTAPPDVDIRLPGSKSITNRALVAAALADGTSTLSGVLFAEDTLAMMDCLALLGVGIEADPPTATVKVTGVAGRPQLPAEPLWVRQSGTTARFIVPVAALAPGSVRVDGDDQIRSRPQADLFDALSALGGRVEGSGGRLPATIVGGSLSGGHVRVHGDTSSQFASALMLVAPALDTELVVELVGELVSAPYLEMTAEVMRAFGAEVSVERGRAFAVSPKPYEARRYTIEPDASTASYFFAAAAVTGGRVAVPGLGSGSLQGDARFVDVLEAMGASVSRSDECTEVRGADVLDGIEVDMADISDTAPTLGAIAPLAKDPVRVTGIGFIRNKESDRVAAVVEALGAVGASATEDADGFTVSPGAVSGGVVVTRDDHRTAMAFTILGLATPGVVIDDPGCVSKTFPGFFDAIDELRARGDANMRVLAIDGPAGSGKSTVAKALTVRLGLEYLDTGAMYRSVTQAALERDIDATNVLEIGALARHIEIDVGRERVLIDGADRTAEIRSPAVEALVSVVAANPAVREALRRQQRAWTRRRGGGILEGRDIGSVVFPSAMLKVYVTASPEERARRRSGQSGVPEADMLREIRRRDHLDSSRTDSPLRVGDGDEVIDTTGMTIDDVVETIARRFEQAEGPQ
jgi:3-phosphoshikimate 1-carboxyvinyltransferase